MPTRGPSLACLRWGWSAFCLASCAPADECEAMCQEAQAAFEGCLAEAGLEYGAGVGYLSPEDYQNWCGTWAWEQRRLGTTEVCAEKRASFEERTCVGYAAAWSPE